jgi:tetratricopeptide (TPR) repeat protein
MPPKLIPAALFSATTLHAALVLAQAPAPAASGSHKHYESGGPAAQPGPNGEVAPRLQNLGAHTFPVSTKSATTQRFINQGLNLAYAFNHAEARRAFREAARLSPSLAMAYWGQALVLGPNINALMEPNDEPHALELVKKAQSLKGTATPREQALIDALAARYSGTPEHRVTNDRAYAEAMRQVQQRFPDDPDIAMLYVESMMDLRPWGYWMRDGRPHEGTAEIVALTERMIRKYPKHPGALHMYVHLVEPTSTPERAEQAADTLLTLMPAAGHMVHMPSHIYQRIGRYADAMESNRLAVAADEDYIAQCRAQGLYPMGYYPHNVHFLWFAATADGQSKVATDAARKVASRVEEAQLAQLPMLAGFRVVPYWAHVRFGRWQEMLAEPEPPSGSVFLAGAWHYARGQALVATGDVAAAERELAALVAALPDKSLDQPLFSPNTGRAILSIGVPVLTGEIAAARGDFAAAIARLEEAVRLEDALVYTEPSEWHSPPRLALGAILLEAGRPAEAETVYWEDLRRNRDNGWALFGVVQALRAQGKAAQAEIAEARFKKAWARADLTLTASRFGRAAAPTSRASR